MYYGSRILPRSFLVSKMFSQDYSDYGYEVELSINH